MDTIPTHPSPSDAFHVFYHLGNFSEMGRSLPAQIWSQTVFLHAPVRVESVAWAHPLGLPFPWQRPLASLDGQGSTNHGRNGISPGDAVLGESHATGASDRPLPIPHPYRHQPLQGSPDRTPTLSPFIYRQIGDPAQVHKGSGCPSTTEKLEV